MKKVILMLLVSMVCFSIASVMAEEKPRLGVLRFTNQTNAGWWSGSMASEMQDMLIAELATIGSFKVLERKELDAVMQEQDLGASGRIAKDTRANIGKITGAKYLVAGTVSAYEESTSGNDGGISFGGISLGGKKTKTYMAVDLKVIDVETGEIADVRTVEARSEGGGMSVGLSLGGFSGNLGGHEDTPAGKAIRGCIIEIAEYLDCAIAQGKDAACMDDYNAKDSSRREKTKKSISLD